MTLYLTRVGTAISILFSVLLGGRSNQTFSARNHARRRLGKPNLSYVIDAVFGKDHCLLSWVRWTTYIHSATPLDLTKQEKPNGTNSTSTS